nr:hypothetical protein [Nocardia sp. SYP-A9097]
MVRIDNPMEMLCPAVQFANIRLDVRFAFAVAHESALLGGVHVLPSNSHPAVEHQLQPHQLFQLLIGQTALQRQPVGLIHLLATLGQAHEQVIAHQVGLRQLQPGVVERLEDSMNVVIPLGHYLNQGQPRSDRLLDMRHIARIRRIVQRDQRLPKESIR